MLLDILLQTDIEYKLQLVLGEIMRYVFIYVICFSLMGILGCSSISTKNIKKGELYIHNFACDSTGVEKSVFGKNEMVYFGFIIRNITKYPIPYKIAGPSTSISFSVDISKADDHVMFMNINGCPEDMYKEYILKPYEQFYQIRNYGNYTYQQSGDYIAQFSVQVHFDPKYTKTSNSNNRFIHFTIRDN